MNRKQGVTGVAVAFILMFYTLIIAATPSEIFTKVSPGIVIVTVLDVNGKVTMQGGGVVIGKNEVVTNCHVLKISEDSRWIPENTITLRHKDRTFSAILKYYDRERDLCLLNASDLNISAVKMGTAKKLKVGQRVYAIGAPQGLELTLTEGLISSLREYGGSQYIQTSTAISPGSSGGGLFDEEGNLIGITSFQIVDGQNLNFALPVDWIRELPKRGKIVPDSDDPWKVFSINGKIYKPDEIQFDDESPINWFGVATALADKKDWEAFLSITKLWIEKEPNNSAAWYYLGNAHAKLHHFDRAHSAFQKATSIEPENAYAWFELGVFF